MSHISRIRRERQTDAQVHEARVLHSTTAHPGNQDVMACHDRRHRQMPRPPSASTLLGVFVTLITASSALHAPATGSAGTGAGSLASSSAPPFEERVEKLLSQLTLPQKISQLNTDSPAIPALNVSAFNWWQECLHGAVDVHAYHHQGATIFPQPLALAATFDPQLVHAIAAAISDELRAKDNQQFGSSGRHIMSSCFGPNINIFRDPRWGRGSETYGEDPALTAAMARAFVTGLQGNHSVYTKVGATCKHCAAYSLEQWEGISRFAFDAQLDPKCACWDVEDTYLPAFRACVSGAGATSVMCSYNAVDGVPACASSWLLQEQLRGKMGFAGVVVSDCGALDNIADQHAWAPNTTAGTAAALRAGTDLACTDYSALLSAVEEGLVTESDVDAALRRVLMARFKLGHFDPPDANPYSQIPPSAIGHPRHLSLAVEAVTKSIVLLKNEVDKSTGRPALPLDLGSLGKITVVGPLANRSEYLLGNYYGQPWGDVTTPLKSIQDYVRGNSRATGGGRRPVVEHVLGSEVMGTAAGVESVVWACRSSDVCIFMLGTTMLGGDVQMCQGAGDYPLLATTVEGEELDRQSLLLPGSQLALVQAAAKRTSTPLVVVLLHGGPLDVEWLQQSPRVGGILTGWFPGQGAAAVADVLFGKVSPSGRLPVTWYFENYTRQMDMADMRMRPWPGRTHRFLQVPALYPFGHGLTYSSFNHSLEITEAAAGPGDSWGGVQVSVAVRNVGSMAAEEVVLVFLAYWGLVPQLQRPGRVLAEQQQQEQRQEFLEQHWEMQQHGALEQQQVGGTTSRGHVLLQTECTVPSCLLGAGATDCGMPKQSLAAFQRVPLVPGQAGSVQLALSVEEFRAAAPGEPVLACGAYEVCIGPLQHTVVLVGCLDCS